MKYKIAISSMALTGKLAQGDPRWEKLTQSFVNQEVELVDLLNAIFLGHPYSAWFNGRRSQETFVCSQFIGVDLDTDDERSTFAAVQRNHFYRMYGSAIHQTPSHMTPGHGPRCRVLFLLDTPISTAAGYRAAMQTVYSFFPGADPSCIDPSRFFYGNAKLQHDLDGITYTQNILPLADLRRYHKQILIQEKQQQAQEQRAYQQKQRTLPKPDSRYVESALVGEIQAVAQTRQGGRNVQLNRSAFKLGTLVGAGVLDETIAKTQLEAAARQTGLPEREIAKTVLSGLRAGKENPRELLQ